MLKDVKWLFNHGSSLRRAFGECNISCSFVCLDFRCLWLSDQTVRAVGEAEVSGPHAWLLDLSFEFLVSVTESGRTWIRRSRIFCVEYYCEFFDYL